ncbi:hypothetical protein QBC39DRAFT_119360 [Podospora conica]|nr:hypothetical protein QBC39DRAFT_119360 [Schizothecium conicum]
MSQLYELTQLDSQPTRAGIRRPTNPAGHRRDKILAALHCRTQVNPVERVSTTRNRGVTLRLSSIQPGTSYREAWHPMPVARRHTHNVVSHHLQIAAAARSKHGSSASHTKIEHQNKAHRNNTSQDSDSISPPSLGPSHTRLRSAPLQLPIRDRREGHHNDSFTNTDAIHPRFPCSPPARRHLIRFHHARPPWTSRPGTQHNGRIPTSGPRSGSNNSQRLHHLSSHQRASPITAPNRANSPAHMT